VLGKTSNERNRSRLHAKALQDGSIVSLTELWISVSEYQILKICEHRGPQEEEITSRWRRLIKGRLVGQFVLLP